jgi:hypothetical protein
MVVLPGESILTLSVRHRLSSYGSIGDLLYTSGGAWVGSAPAAEQDSDVASLARR